MKKAFIAVVTGLALLSSVTAFAKDFQKITGEDWLLMSGPERVAFLKDALGFLEKKGIPLKHPAPYYGSQLNIWVDQPGANKALALNLLTTIIYKDDARTRPMIDKMRVKPGAKQSAASPSKSAQPAKRQVI